MAVGLGEHEAVATVRSGLQAGESSPRGPLSLKVDALVPSTVNLSSRLPAVTDSREAAQLDLP
jgi:hypothetical protein